MNRNQSKMIMQNVNVTKSPPKQRIMRLPLGRDNFRELIDERLDFVDKTLFIKEIFDNVGTKATVITRPRRFGKTLNMSMLEHFLAAEVRGQPTKGLFDGLKIAELGDEYMQYQGKFPVISVTFKDLSSDHHEGLYKVLCQRIAALYRTHQYLLSSPKLTDYEKETFSSVLEEQASLERIGNSLYDLSYYIYQHTRLKPWILIDEYDTPIQSAYLNNYYDAIINLMRKFFGTALKGNDYMERAVVTGILRVSKESLFSGANNVIVYSLFDSNYSEHFGFTETEVEELLKKANLSERFANIRHWYNGYQMGNSVIYNPWSLINCVEKRGLLKTYWVNTSGNDLVRYLLARSTQQVKMDLETIIQGETITALIDENMVFGHLEKSRNAIWSLLLFCGYLKVTHLEYKDAKIQCELAAPNQEVMALYRDVILEWLSDPLGEEYLNFLLSLIEGRIQEFTHRLQEYLVQTLSIFDASGKEPEKFYHGFVLGMMVSLSDTHEVKSNRESGYGRYDVMLIPKDPEALGIILEFKTVRDEKTSLEKAAEDALQQIKDRGYEAELRQRGLQKILSLGLAFRGKEVAVLSVEPRV